MDEVLRSSCAVDKLDSVLKDLHKGPTDLANILPKLVVVIVDKLLPWSVVGLDGEGCLEFVELERALCSSKPAKDLSGHHPLSRTECALESGDDLLVPMGYIVSF